jgi:hypothetical protein
MYRESAYDTVDDLRSTYEHTIRRTKNRLIIDTPINTMGDIAVRLDEITIHLSSLLT